MNSTVRGLSEMGLSQGQLTNAMLAAGLNKTKATSDAMMKGSDINRQENRYGQEFNNRNQTFNIGQSNREKEINQREIDATNDRKRMSRDSMFLSAGELGKEESYKNRIYNLTGGYRTDGSLDPIFERMARDEEERLAIEEGKKRENTGYRNGGLLDKYNSYLKKKKSEEHLLQKNQEK